MRTKLRYVLLIGSSIILLCFVYLHSGLKQDEQDEERRMKQDADSALRRKPAHIDDHIYQRRDNDLFINNAVGRETGREHEEKEDEEEEEKDWDGDEDSDTPSVDENEKAEDTDAIKHPDDHMKSEKSKAIEQVVRKPPLNAAPTSDPIARFNWNKGPQGAQSQQQQGAPQRSLGSSACTLKTNITFLKVHKTGSSTVQNIFLRYGDHHSLSFVLPVRGHHLGYPNFFEKKHMLKTKSGVYNIFCHHARFSNDVREVMPTNSVYISILRDPVKVFESAFTYFKLDMRMKIAGEKDAMKIFMDNPRKYYNDFPNKVHARNGMLHDFGVPLTEFDNPTFMNRAISMINDQFDLVMIAEYFEESLLLMRELLCWSLEDVVVFRQNARNADSVQAVDGDMRSRILSWNSGDVLLYNFFNKTLWEKVDRYGRNRMEQDKEQLRKKTQKVFDQCIATDSAPRDKGDFKVWQPPGVNINAFVLKPEAKGNRLCESMVKPEIQYTMELKIKQFPDMNFSRVRQKRVPSNLLGGIK